MRTDEHAYAYTVPLYYPVTKSNARSSLLTSRSGLNGFPRDGTFVSFALPFPFPLPVLELSDRFGDSEPPALVSGCSVSPGTLERRARRGIIVVVVVVVITLDASSGDGDKPPPGTNVVVVGVVAITAEDDDGVGAPTRDDDASQNGEPWDCVGDGVLDSCTVTVDVIVFALSVVTLRVGAEAGWTTPRLVFSSPARFRLPARCLPKECASLPSSATISIARATPRPRLPSTDMSERVRTIPPALTVLVVTPVLWNGSTLGAVRSAGESSERSPNFAPGTISPGRWEVGEVGKAWSDKVALEKVEAEVVGRMRWWGGWLLVGCVDRGSVTTSTLLLLTLARAWRVRSMAHKSHSSSQSLPSPPSSSMSRWNGPKVLESSVVACDGFLRSSVPLYFRSEGPRGGPPHKIQPIASLTLPRPDCCARWQTSMRHSG